MTEQMIEFSICCLECDSSIEATIEMGVFSEIKCAECFELYDVTVTVERKEEA